MYMYLLRQKVEWKGTPSPSVYTCNNCDWDIFATPTLPLCLWLMVLSSLQDTHGAIFCLKLKEAHANARCIAVLLKSKKHAVSL